MNKFVTSLCAFCCLLIASAEQTKAQLPREPQPVVNRQKTYFKLDENFRNSYSELVGSDVEVIGKIHFVPEEARGYYFDSIFSYGDRMLILANWGRQWEKKKVRIIGKISKGIDESIGLEKFGGKVPAMTIRVDYLLTIKSIELLEDKVPEPRPAPQVPQMVPQR